MNATEKDRLILAGQNLKTIITHAQGKFVKAIYTLKREHPTELTKEELGEIQKEIIQANLDIVIYKDLLRRCYEAMGVPNPVDELT